MNVFKKIVYFWKKQKGEKVISPQEQKLIIIAGCNGSGKTSLYQHLILQRTKEFVDMPYINVDNIARELSNKDDFTRFKEAGKIAILKKKEYFKEQKSFIQETTLCGHYPTAMIKEAIQLGYKTEIHFIVVESKELAKKRIELRVLNGGHSVDAETVDKRYEESLQKIKSLLPLIDETFFYDNTHEIQNVAYFQKDECVFICQTTPL